MLYTVDIECLTRSGNERIYIAFGDRIIHIIKFALNSVKFVLVTNLCNKVDANVASIGIRNNEFVSKISIDFVSSSVLI